uniref:Uncharacterized protein n=1 Tax=Arundo donax TaxID=35708 RepID=A0A0A8ZDA3_ARUDO
MGFCEIETINQVQNLQPNNVACVSFLFSATIQEVTAGIAKQRYMLSPPLWQHVKVTC